MDSSRVTESDRVQIGVRLSLGTAQLLQGNNKCTPPQLKDQVTKAQAAITIAGCDAAGYFRLSLTEAAQAAEERSTAWSVGQLTLSSRNFRRLRRGCSTAV